MQSVGAFRYMPVSKAELDKDGPVLADAAADEDKEEPAPMDGKAGEHAAARDDKKELAADADEVGDAEPTPDLGKEAVADVSGAIGKQPWITGLTSKYKEEIVVCRRRRTNPVYAQF